MRTEHSSITRRCGERAWLIPSGIAGLKSAKYAFLPAIPISLPARWILIICEGRVKTPLNSLTSMAYDFVSGNV